MLYDGPAQLCDQVRSTAYAVCKHHVGYVQVQAAHVAAAMRDCVVALKYLQLAVQASCIIAVIKMSKPQSDALVK
jgi:hypothetical protein